MLACNFGLSECNRVKVNKERDLRLLEQRVLNIINMVFIFLVCSWKWKCGGKSCSLLEMFYVFNWPEK